MPTASPARVAANIANAARSTGPRTPEGKARSRANALKHGLTGEGVVLPMADALEVARKAEAYRAELAPSSDLERDLVDRAALLAVRMKRSVDQQSAALAERVRQVEADFEAPEGVDDPEEVANLRLEAARRAMFDPSKEATLARRYEAAAERGFFRALKELRQLQKGSATDSAVAEEAAQTRKSLERLGSFLPVEAPSRPIPVRTPSAAPKAPSAPWDPFAPSHFDVPISIGRAR